MHFRGHPVSPNIAEKKEGKLYLIQRKQREKFGIKTLPFIAARLQVHHQMIVTN